MKKYSQFTVFLSCMIVVVVAALTCIAVTGWFTVKAVSDNGKQHEQHNFNPTLEEAVNRDLDMSLDQWVESTGGSTAFNKAPGNMMNNTRCSPGVQFSQFDPSRDVSDDVIITAAHCLNSEDPIYWTSNAGPHDPKNTGDVAVVSHRDTQIPAADTTGYVTGFGEVKDQDKVCAFGYTSGWRCGVVTDTETHNGQYFTSDFPSAPGDSGGVVYRGREVVGILSGTINLDYPYPADHMYPTRDSESLIATFPQEMMDVDVPDSTFRTKIPNPTPPRAPLR